MPALALATSLFVLSQSALLVRLAKSATALDIGLWRMAFAVPMLLALGAARGQLGALYRLRGRQLAGCLASGLALFFHWWTWFVAVQTTALANAMVLFAMSPLFTALGAWMFFREPFYRRHGVALGLCFLGVCLIFRDSLTFAPEHLRGDLLGFVASLLFSVYVLVGKAVRRGLDNVPFAIATYAACGLMFLVVLGTTGALRADFAPATWGAIVALAVGPTLLGHALFTWCLEYFNVNLMNILILTEPVLGSLAAYWVLGETFTSGVVLGFGTVCAGMLCLFLPALRRVA